MRAARFIAAALLVGLCSAAIGCPMCKDAVTTQSAATVGGENIARRSQGYYLSIVGMVCMPFVLVGGVTWALARERRNALRQA